MTMTLGQRIQEGRTRLDLSQEALGEKLGVSRQAVSKWEADAAVPDTDKLIALSRLFGMTLNELLQVDAPEVEAPGTEAPGDGGDCPPGPAEPAGEDRAEEVPDAPPDAPDPVPEGELSQWKRLAALALVLLFIVVQATTRLQISNLEKRVAELEEQAARTEFEAGMSSLYTSAAYGVKEEDVLYLQVSPTWEDDEQEVAFVVLAGDAGEKRVQAQRQEDGNYAAEIWLGSLESSKCTVLVEFSYFGRQRAQPLLRLSRPFEEWVCKSF